MPQEIKRHALGIIMFLLALIVTLSFFGLAGAAGKGIMVAFSFLAGKVIFIAPLILTLTGLIFFSANYKKISLPLILAIFIFVLGLAGIFEGFFPGLKYGGWLGYLIALPFLKLFGFLVTQIIFAVSIIIAGLIFWYLLKPRLSSVRPAEELELKEEKSDQPSLIRKLFGPKFKVKKISPSAEEEKEPIEKAALESKAKPAELVPPLMEKGETSYQLPPIDLLEAEKGSPSAGDTRNSAAIIKKTLQNFDISVEMSEINIGPTVTQYTFKPAEGVKLSRITALSNDLALALASHPIRIEAPVPGKSLVGIEVPNKVRAQVRLRNLIENQSFQKSLSRLALVLGRDVSGSPVYVDLARMPHLLVAGATGAGKTIFLNNLVLSFLYRNSPEILRFIMIDPKRVEFPVYNELPHLLAPVIFDPQRAVNALKWLIGEMERRFSVLALAKTRDIAGFNRQIKEREEVMPYIVLIIDELADLMASRGKEIEAGIVRLAQMARAVGIHLVVATQRPSVEVITGLIKANITSRITFQVASQVDSRTVLDTSGAEKLLGSGDMLYLSADLGKPRRIQSSFISEKEVRKVVDYINSKNRALFSQVKIENELSKDLETELESPRSDFEIFSGQNDPLYEEARRIVTEARKASASLLQRRLRIGYARAARLIDFLEEKGVVGPGDGARPREVFFSIETENEKETEGGNDWQKV